MQEGRITHDNLDIGGRAKQDVRAGGAVIEIALNTAHKPLSLGLSTPQAQHQN
jgi:hypothetical protein